MANLLDWFSPADIVSLPDGLSVGDPLVIQPPLLADGVRITLPTGEARDLPVNGSALVFTDTNQLGLYRLEIVQDGEVRAVAEFCR